MGARVAEGFQGLYIGFVLLLGDRQQPKTIMTHLMRQGRTGIRHRSPGRFSRKGNTLGISFLTGVDDWSIMQWK